MNTGYSKLSQEEVINLAIDFIKVGHKLPTELKAILEEMDLLHILDHRGDDEEQDD